MRLKKCTTGTRRLAWLTLLFVAVPASLSALEPPTPQQIERYKKDGTLDQRVEAAFALGNHEVDPYLSNRAARKLRNLYWRSEGKEEELSELLALPEEWASMPSKGTVKVLALLIAFSDYPAPATETPEVVSFRLFGDGTDAPPFDSLHNFYNRSSFNQLDITGDTLGWYTTSYPRSSVAMAYQGRDALIREVLEYYQAAGHDFSQYDNDGDGVIDYFMVFWTGPQGEWASFWWGYQTGFVDASYVLDGKRLGDYSWQWISDAYPNGAFSPLTVIHETAHALGLPDYYDYDDSVGPRGGVGGLDIMDGLKGDHNAFSKFLLEWIDVGIYKGGATDVTLYPSCMISPPTYPITVGAAAFRKGMTGTDPFGEYFMVQNRQLCGNDSNLPGTGLLIWHVNAELGVDGQHFKYNNADTDHKLLRLMEADGNEEIEQNLEAGAEDFYGTGQQFGLATLPSNRLYSGESAGMEVTGITTSGNAMSCTIRDPNCSYSVSPASIAVPGRTVSTGVIDVGATAGNGCSWTAASYASWLHLTGNTSGTGSGTVSYQADYNSGPARTGTVIVARQAVTVRQETGCVYSLRNYSAYSGSGGYSGSVVVSAGPGCAGWQAVSNVSWITVTSVVYSSDGSSGEVFYTVSANSGPARAGSISVAGQTFKVEQASGCTTRFNPPSDYFLASASSGYVSIDTGTGCGWSAASEATWITITSGNSGSGSGRVGYSLAQNSGASRDGTIAVGGKKFKISQDKCSYRFDPTSQIHSKNSEVGTFSVITANGCSWTATSSSSWIVVVRGRSGSIGGGGWYYVAPNVTGQERVGTIVVGEAVFTVRQLASTDVVQ